MNVKPHIRYCSTIFNHATRDIINNIQKILNDGMRTVLNIVSPMDTHIVDLLKEMDMLKFEDMIYLDSMTLIYKLEHNLLPPGLSRLLRRREIHEHDTRRRDVYYVEQRRTQGAFNSIYYKSVTKYNDIANDVKESLTVKEFRSKIVKQVKETY